MTKPAAFRVRMKRFLRGESGAAGAEFAIWLIVLVPALLNLGDLGVYAYDRVQVANAAQSAAQAGWAYWVNCTSTPTSTCSGFSTAVSNSIAYSSALGSGVITRDTSKETEGYYCADVSTGKLVSNASSTTCTSGAKAGYYFKVAVKYTYSPLFHGVTVGSLLQGEMDEAAWTRLK